MLYVIINTCYSDGEKVKHLKRKVATNQLSQWKTRESNWCSPLWCRVEMQLCMVRVHTDHLQLLCECSLTGKTLAFQADVTGSIPVIRLAMLKNLAIRLIN